MKSKKERCFEELSDEMLEKVSGGTGADQETDFEQETGGGGYGDLLRPIDSGR